MPSKTAQPASSSTSSSADDAQDVLFDTLSNTDALYGPGRRNRMCHTYLENGVAIRYLADLFNRSESTISNYARKGRNDLANRKFPWYFIPSRIRTQLIGDMIEFNTPAGFNDLVTNLDNVEKYILTPYAANAIRFAARMPRLIETELKTDLERIASLHEEVKDLILDQVQCQHCRLPATVQDELSARKFRRGVLCASCVQDAKDELRALALQPGFARAAR